METIVGMEESINTVIADNCSRAPLLWAAKEGNDRVVELLLRRTDIDLNMEDTCGRTPLSWAASRGHAGVVKLLLGLKDIRPDRQGGGTGQTPLSWAAKMGRERVVELLLGREDVHPAVADYAGRTPLS